VVTSAKCAPFIDILTKQTKNAKNFFIGQLFPFWEVGAAVRVRQLRHHVTYSAGGSFSS